MKVSPAQTINIICHDFELGDGEQGRKCNDSKWTQEWNVIQNKRNDAPGQWELEAYQQRKAPGSYAGENARQRSYDHILAKLS